MVTCTHETRVKTPSRTLRPASPYGSPDKLTNHLDGVERAEGAGGRAVGLVGLERAPELLGHVAGGVALAERASQEDDVAGGVGALGEPEPLRACSTTPPPRSPPPRTALPPPLSACVQKRKWRSHALHHL